MVEIVTDKVALSKPTIKIVLTNTLLAPDLSEVAEDIDRAVEALLSLPTAIAVAANQVGSHHSFFVAKYDLLKLSNATYKSLGGHATKKPDYFGSYIYLNPTFEVVKGKGLVEYKEGCLSHDREVVVQRHKEIIFEGLELRLLSDTEAELVPFKKKLKNISAQIVQHEVNHLLGNGIWQHEK